MAAYFSILFSVWYATHIPYAINVFDWQGFQDDSLRRQFSKLLGNGKSLDAESSAALSAAMGAMSSIYASGTVGDDTRCLYLEGGGGTLSYPPASITLTFA